MFSLLVTDVGNNRLQVLRLIVTRCGLASADAKARVSSQRPILETSSPVELEDVAAQLESAGAKCCVRADQINLQEVIPGSLSLDFRTCSKCGAEVYIALPGVHSKEDFTRLAQTARSESFKRAAEAGGIHPGIYCPNGCGFSMIDFEPFPVVGVPHPE